MNNTGIYNANTHNTDQNIYSRQNFKQYHTNKSNICGISDDKTDCSRQSAFCDSTNYADLPLGCVCEGTEVRNSADENVKIYNIKHSHQTIEQAPKMPLHWQQPHLENRRHVTLVSLQCSHRSL